MKKILLPVRLAAATFLLIAMPSISMAAPAQSGIEGQTFLYISYGAPIEVEPGVWIGIGAVQLPAATALTVYSSDTGREASRATTDASGRFAVALHPGKYLLVPDDLRTFCSSLAVDPIEVTVHAREFTMQNIFYFQDGPCSIAGQ